MARMRGVGLLIGTAGSPEKAQLAREAGAHEVILYREADFLEESTRLTNGRGLDVVYDSVGKDTFMKSLAALKSRGMLVLFGASSGAVPPFDVNELQNHGSAYLTRPTLAHYTATREELLWRSGDLFKWIQAGKLKVRIDRTYPLAEAAKAQQDLASRATAGKILLIP
jgi:NADPH2:quinone reductase